MKKTIGLIALCAVIFAGHSWNKNRRTKVFVTEMKKEFRGYRLEHFPAEKLLFLHAPDGSKEGAPLNRKCIEEIVLTKNPASENTFNKDLYYWSIGYAISTSPGGSGSWIRMNLRVPYFSMEPVIFLNEVRKEFPEIDVKQSLQYAKQLEQGGCSEWNCKIWVNPTYKPTGTSSPAEVCSVV